MEEAPKKERRHSERSGWKSSKLHLALIAMTLITVVYAWRPGPAFSEYAGWIFAAAGMYSGSRVLETFVQVRKRADPPRTDGQ